MKRERSLCDYRSNKQCEVNLIQRCHENPCKTSYTGHTFKGKKVDKKKLLEKHSKSKPHECLRLLRVTFADIRSLCLRQLKESVTSSKTSFITYQSGKFIY